MPNIKSAKKRMRSSETSRVRNLSMRTRVKTARRNMIEALAAGDAEKCDTIYRQYCSVLDKAAKSGVIKKNTATRRKARAADKVRALKA